jgi:hypothetical protein
MGWFAMAQHEFRPAAASDAVDNLTNALGRAVVRHWSRLPHDIQRVLFEAAAENDGVRQQLAVYLHGKHVRTLDALHAQATHEPDSLGG